MTHDDAYLILVDQLRKGTSVAHPQYGYDVYIPQVIYAHLKSENPRADSNEIQRRTIDLSPYFYAAAWELCRRGILRPGVKQMNTRVTDDGTGGNGYSITPAGRDWLAEPDKETFIPTEPFRFQQLLQPFEDRFGPGFRERAQEAARCYRAHAQCPRKLWLEHKRRDLIPTDDPIIYRRAVDGNIVGEQARKQLGSDFIWPPLAEDKAAAADKARGLLAESPSKLAAEVPMYHDGLYARADALVPEAAGYVLQETKAATFPLKKDNELGVGVRLA